MYMFDFGLGDHLVIQTVDGKRMRYVPNVWSSYCLPVFIGVLIIGKRGAKSVACFNMFK